MKHRLPTFIFVVLQSCFLAPCVAADETVLHSLALKPELSQPKTREFAYRLVWFDPKSHALFQVNKSHYSDGSAPSAFNAHFYRNWCSKWFIPVADISAACCLVRDGHWVPNAKIAKGMLEEMFGKAPVNLPGVRTSWFSKSGGITMLPNSSWWIVQIPKRYGSMSPEVLFHPPSDTTLMAYAHINKTPEKRASKDFTLDLRQRMFFCFESNAEPIQFDILSNDRRFSSDKTIFKDLRNNSVAAPLTGIGEDGVYLYVANVRGLTKKSAQLIVWASEEKKVSDPQLEFLRKSDLIRKHFLQF
jgi:hypothetical protein